MKLSQLLKELPYKITVNNTTYELCIDFADKIIGYQYPHNESGGKYFQRSFFEKIKKGEKIEDAGNRLYNKLQKHKLLIKINK